MRETWYVHPMVDRLFPPVLSRRRIVLGCAVAVVADLLQLGFGIIMGPMGMISVDEAIDVCAMVAETLILGYHPLFLPTFLAKAVPVLDLVPSWTGCTLLVIAMRRKQTAAAPAAATAAPPPVPPMASARPVAHDVIDV